MTENLLDVADPPPIAQSRVTRSTLAGEVEIAIRKDIISGALQPSQRLRAAELTERYGVSATPLREALQRLAAENLVAVGPHFGATVAPISGRELADIYQTREVLEGFAIERSVELGDKAWRRQVTDAYEAFARMHDGEGLPSQEDPRSGPCCIARSTASCSRPATHRGCFGSSRLWPTIRSATGCSAFATASGTPSRSTRTSIEPPIAPDPASHSKALIRHLDGTVEFLSPLIPPVNGWADNGFSRLNDFSSCGDSSPRELRSARSAERPGRRCSPGISAARPLRKSSRAVLSRCGEPAEPSGSPKSTT